VLTAHGSASQGLGKWAGDCALFVCLIDWRGSVCQGQGTGRGALWL